jgi:hypothetical protein
MTAVRSASAAIALPVYRGRIDGERLAAVDRALSVLRHGDWRFLAPQSLDTSFYEKRYGLPVVRFADSCFESIKSYNRLLLSDELYAAFEGYDFLLVTQDDVYVLRDDLPLWLSSPYDYVGAPWPDGIDFTLGMSRRPSMRRHPLKAYVGNGGFSLRRVRSCRELLAEFPEEATWFRETGFNEDLFFAVLGQMSRQFILPSLRVAAGFAWERSLSWMHLLCDGRLPMAVHSYLNHEAAFFLKTIQPYEA